MDVYRNFMVNSTTRFFVANFPSILLLMRKKLDVRIISRNLDIQFPLFQPGYLNERVTQYHTVHLHQLLSSVMSASNKGSVILMYCDHVRQQNLRPNIKAEGHLLKRRRYHDPFWKVQSCSCWTSGPQKL